MKMGTRMGTGTYKMQMKGTRMGTITTQSNGNRHNVTRLTGKGNRDGTNANTNEGGAGEGIKRGKGGDVAGATCRRMKE